MQFLILAKRVLYTHLIWRLRRGITSFVRKLLRQNSPPYKYNNKKALLLNFKAVRQTQVELHILKVKSHACIRPLSQIQSCYSEFPVASYVAICSTTHNHSTETNFISFIKIYKCVNINKSCNVYRYRKWKHMLTKIEIGITQNQLVPSYHKTFQGNAFCSLLWPQEFWK